MAKKIYYKIGEACRILDIQPYVLRYWETEFPALSPSKSRSGQRVYSEKELAVIQRIKKLLYEEGYTIAGAKKKLEGELSGGQLELEMPAPSAERPVPKVPEPPAESTADPAGALPDRITEKRLERLRAGLKELLTEARDLLEYLDRQAG